MQNLTQIITFVEVVNQNSFAGAARSLKVTPAAVSKQINTLEKDLGVQLLQRSTRRIQLTSEGEIYFEHAKLIIDGDGPLVAIGLDGQFAPRFSAD